MKKKVKKKKNVKAKKATSKSGKTSKSKVAKKASSKKAISKKASSKNTKQKKAASNKKTSTKNKATQKSSSKKFGSTNFRVDLTPLRDRILISRDGFSEKTPGGLYIPETALDRPPQGKVLAVGKGAFNKKGNLKPLDVRVGDKVLYAKYAGSEIKINGQELLLLTESEVLGIVES